MIKFLFAFGIGVLVIINWPSINAWVNQSEIAKGPSENHGAPNPATKKADESNSLPASSNNPEPKKEESRAAKLF